MVQRDLPDAAASFINDLAARNLIDGTSKGRVLSAARQTGESACLLLSKLGILEEQSVAAHLAAQLGLPLLTPGLLPAEPLFHDTLSTEFVKLHHVLPLQWKDGELYLAVADPFHRYALHAVELACEARLSLVIGEISQIQAAFRHLYEAPKDASSAGSDVSDTRKDIEHLIELAAEAPVVHFVNRLIQSAADARASDIHLEPFSQGLRIRLRIDGVLRAAEPPPAHLQAAILSRIKLMASLNIAERRLPQDGRLRATVRGKHIDLRVATSPSLHGESIVLRILDKGAVNLDLGALGMGETDLKRYESALDKTTGVVLVTGPTGSGKTTTLYASLLRFNDGERKILTVEDPVEYELAGVSQVQIKPQIGFGFPQALRSFLRQDPDIMLVGEIRDLETAQIAAQAALTGHKVLSTLHTNDAASSVTRLLDMGLDDFIVAATLEAVVAQRLVRVLCSLCKTPAAPPAHAERIFAAAKQAAPSRVFEPEGCPDCAMTGFKGRIGVYEVLLMSSALKDLVGTRPSATAVQMAAVSGGMRPMFEDGLVKVSQGLTTIAELFRVCSPAAS